MFSNIFLSSFFPSIVSFILSLPLTIFVPLLFLGLLDVVFDSYSLSLSDTVIGWRKGYTQIVSTFVHSARRVSGTSERTVVGAPTGHGELHFLSHCSVWLTHLFLFYSIFSACILNSHGFLSFLRSKWLNELFTIFVTFSIVSLFFHFFHVNLLYQINIQLQVCPI